MSDWGDDAVRTYDSIGPQVFEGDVPLTRRQIELRDGIAPPPQNEGIARARRLEQMQADIASCRDLVADLDRWLDGQPTVNDLVPTLMKGHAARLRREAAAKARQLQDDLQYLRSRP